LAIFGYFWLFLAIFGYFWLFLAIFLIFGYFPISLFFYLETNTTGYSNEVIIMPR
jgi:hypothetical protein